MDRPEHKHNENCGCGHEHGHEHEHHHDHGDSCGCGHGHGHEHEHHHDHDEGCGHGHGHKHEHHHDHGENCGCGHGHGHKHDHHHDHGDSCGCGHEHGHKSMDTATRSHTHFVAEHRPAAGHPADCRCEVCNPRVEYCDLCKKPLASCHCVMPDERMEKRVYLLEGLDCANCAAKIEAKIRQMPEIEYATVTFATKQLRIAAPNYHGLLPKIQQTVDSVEDGVAVVPRDKAQKDQALPGKKSRIPNELRPAITIGAGGIFFFAGIMMEYAKAPLAGQLAAFVAAYLILGGQVLITAAKNIAKGQVFDENFLMGIATLGAFAIQEWPEAVGVMFFYRIGEYFEERAVEKSRSQIMDAIDMRPETVNLIVDGEVRIINADEAAVGDLLLVRPGDRIPLDGTILEGESRIDTSPVTGEPVPVRASSGDAVISGCVNTSGQLKIRVEKILSESMVTRILDSVENAAASKPNIDKFITRFARIYTPFVVFFALFVAFVLPYFLPNWHFFVNPGYTGAETAIRGTSGTASIFTALTFLVISCPCALVLSVPLAFFSGIGAASKKGILFKGGVAIESLKNIKAVVMDKTGTITKGNFTVQHAAPAEGTMLTPDKLLSLCASCEQSSTHPIGISIVEAARQRGICPERPIEIEEIAGQGIRAALTDGTVLCGSQKLMEHYGIDLSAYKKDTSGTEVLTALNGTFIGHIVISDTLKEDAVSAIANTKKMGIVTAMLTGDTKSSADAVARKAGIDETYARLLPEDKWRELKNIRQKYGSVMFVGDGINDAPVLAGADVGAAMGSGADAAIEAADVVFMTSEVSAIPQAIKIARATGKISWQNVYFALAVKIIVMAMGLFGFANMWIAVFADTGVSVLCLLNSIRILYRN